MMTVVAKVENAERVARLFATAVLKIGPSVDEVLDEYAEKVADTQRGLVAYQSGTTRDSIDWDAPTAGVRSIGPSWFVGRFLEHGTSKMAPQPFVGPSLDMHADDLFTDLRDAGYKTLSDL